MAALPRRDFLALGAAAAAAALLPGRAFASIATGTKLHGLSAFGDLKYGPDFAHFDYVKLDAPQGGTFNFSPPNWGYNQNTETFNTLNSFTSKGDAPPRMEMCFDALMVRALDEPDAVYGQIADGVTISDDRNSFEFSLRPEARFHDGTPITAQDAAFTFKLYKDKGHPDLSLSLTHMDDAVAVDERTLRLTFSGKQSARTILNIVQFPIVSKAYLRGQSVRLLTIEPAARLRRLQSRALLGRNVDRIRARARLLGQGPCRQSRPQQFRAHPHRILPGPYGRLRSLQERRDHLPRGIHLARLGDGLRLSGVHRRQGGQARVPQRKSAVDAGDRGQPAARTVSRFTRAAGDRALLRLRMDAAQFLLRFLRTLAFVLREIRLSRRRTAVAGRAGLAGAAARPASGGGLRRSGRCSRSPTAPAATASCLAGQRSFWARPAGSGPAIWSSTTRAKGFRPNSWSTTIRSSRSIRPGSRT